MEEVMASNSGFRESRNSWEHKISAEKKEIAEIIEPNLSDCISDVFIEAIGVYVALVNVCIA